MSVHSSTLEDLPLQSRTPDAWGEAALKDVRALLSDHAYLEKKAASNALELLNRWPEPAPPTDWTATLAAVAHDEASHLASVLKLLARRGGRLDRTHRNPYANGLRALVRKGEGNAELADRLLVSAMIEVRSCERFDVLGRVADGIDRELSRFFHRLGASELGHYRVFLRLAGYAVSPQAVESRWTQMLEAEARILAAQTPGPRIHSGIAEIV